jgi:hypothetical protein
MNLPQAGGCQCGKVRYEPGLRSVSIESGQNGGFPQCIWRHLFQYYGISGIRRAAGLEVAVSALRHGRA